MGLERKEGVKPGNCGSPSSVIPVAKAAAFAHQKEKEHAYGRVQAYTGPNILRVGHEMDVHIDMECLVFTGRCNVSHLAM